MTTDKEERDRRRQRAREALEALLARVRELCRTLEQLDQWYQILGGVHQVFQDWEDALPKRARQRLEKALEQAQRVRGDLSLACQALQTDLQGVINAASAPTPGFPLKGVLIGTAAAAAVGTGIVAAMVLPDLLEEGQVVAISVHNECSESLRYTAAGVEPPSGDIAPFTTKSVGVPAIEVSVERGRREFVVSFRGRKFLFQVEPGVEVSFNDEPISPGFAGSFDLGEQEEHELFILCP